MRQEPRLAACSFLETFHWRIVVAIALLILLAGVGYSLHLGFEIRYHDEADYVLLAQNLRDHGAYTYDGLSPTGCGCGENGCSMGNVFEGDDKNSCRFCEQSIEDQSIKQLPYQR